MTYREFKRLVQEAGWTLAEMRFDVRPPEELLRLLDRLGLKKYERFVLKWQTEMEN
jgi:hypothetical protein